MPKHVCIDPYDPYAQAEVLVAFERIPDGVRLTSVVDASDNDLLADLEDVECQALVREIMSDDVAEQKGGARGWSADSRGDGEVSEGPRRNGIG